MEKKLFQPHYDRAFKTKVVQEYLTTGCSKMSLLRKYNIQYKSAIQAWMRVLGYTDPYEQPQKFNFGKINFTIVAKKAPTNETAQERKIRELERQLEDEKLRSEAYARIIEIAEKEYKIPIRKKPGTK